MEHPILEPLQHHAFFVLSDPLRITWQSPCQEKFIGISRIAKYFKKDKCQMGEDCSFIHSQKKNRSTSPRRNGKGKGKDSEKEKVTVAIVNVASRRLREPSGKLFELELKEHPLESRGKPRASATIQNAHDEHSCAQNKDTSVRKEKHQILTSRFASLNGLEKTVRPKVYRME